MKMTDELRDTVRKATLREILDVIDVYLSDGERSDDLAHVLSALRGPDENVDGKYESTAVIRHNALPRTSMNNSPGWNFNRTSKMVTIPVDASEHFQGHIRRAAISLGIPEVD